MGLLAGESAFARAFSALKRLFRQGLRSFSSFGPDSRHGVSAQRFDEVLHRVDAALVHHTDRLGSDHRNIDLAAQEINILFPLHTNAPPHSQQREPEGELTLLRCNPC